MRLIELHEFQEKTAAKLFAHIRNARNEVPDNPQAIVLSSPTGSGKTVTVLSLLESIYAGQDEHSGNPEATFLWFSDSPELNQQSLEKIALFSSQFSSSRLVSIDADFDHETLSPGHIYFLNTQKLGKKSLLVQKGDNRNSTIWETLKNIILSKPKDFFLVIDEAHRGMSKPGAEAQTIVQRFLKGNGVIPAVPLVIGMSATPQRFETLLEQTGRIKRPVTIDVSDVKASGLLKDRIILYYPNEVQPSDFTLLRAAAKELVNMEAQWKAYCVKQREKLVRPVLVVQVQDGRKNELTKTDLAQAIRALEEEIPGLSSDEIAHCFQESGQITLDNRILRKIEASAIQGDPFVRVVFFKTALTTGWDCPRAEVMMSFRRAEDATLIAQLIGRMVRTPLARRIESDERLNSVSLYLPHYDRTNLQTVIEKLRRPDPEDTIPVDVEIDGELKTYNRAPGTEDIFSALAQLPSYEVDWASQLSWVKRLMKLTRLLSMDSIQEDAGEKALAALVNRLGKERDRISAKSDILKQIAESRKIDVRAITVEYGAFKAVKDSAIQMDASPENIDELFGRCDRLLGKGEGIHMAYWKANTRPGDDPYRAKLELHVIVQDPATWPSLEACAKELFQSVYDQHKAKTMELPESKAVRYRRILGHQKDPLPTSLNLPANIQERPSEQPFEKHLYVDAHGQYFPAFNQWERTLLDLEMQNDQFAGWLRNPPRKDRSLCIPYQAQGRYSGFYPDFLIFRKADKGLLIDIAEPHDIRHEDSWSKVKGLAEYAAKHGHLFGRILFAIFDKEARFKTLNLNDLDTQNRMRRLSSATELQNVFQMIDS